MVEPLDKWDKIFWVVILVVLPLLVAGIIVLRQADEGVIAELNSINAVAYDPNDAIYSFLEVAEPNWVGKFGDSERTRLIYNLSKLRAVVAIQSRRILELESFNKEPNEAKQ